MEREETFTQNWNKTEEMFVKAKIFWNIFLLKHSFYANEMQTFFLLLFHFVCQGYTIV